MEFGLIDYPPVIKHKAIASFDEQNGRPIKLDLLGKIVSLTDKAFVAARRTINSFVSGDPNYTHIRDYDKAGSMFDVIHDPVAPNAIVEMTQTYPNETVIQYYWISDRKDGYGFPLIFLGTIFDGDFPFTHLVTCINFNLGEIGDKKQVKNKIIETFTADSTKHIKVYMKGKSSVVEKENLPERQKLNLTWRHEPTPI